MGCTVDCVDGYRPRKCPIDYLYLQLDCVQRLDIMVAFVEVAKLARGPLALMGTSHVARPMGDQTRQGCNCVSCYGSCPLGDFRKLRNRCALTCAMARKGS